MAIQSQVAKRMSATGVATAVTIIALTGTPSIFAQNAGSVNVDVGECVELESPADRLACFEAQVDAALDDRGAAEVDDRALTTRDRAAAAQRPERPAERQLERRAPEQQRAASNEANEDEDEYFGTITALRERTPSSYIITLDNGQVWAQTMAKQYPLRPGLAVRIYPSRWGASYRLAGEGTGGFIQVRRIE